MQDPRRAAVWSRYWQAGAAHACPGSVDERLAGALSAFWTRLGPDLRPGARVLEIGAGNGAVTRVLLEAAASAAPAIDAVDLARLRPAWLGGLQPGQAACVRFHEGTAAEHLPFENAVFDLAVGQFAFEYMERDRVLPELARCSRPGARLALVMHHRGSRLVGVATEERRHLERVTAAGGLFDLVGGLIPDLALAGTAEGVRQLRLDPAADGRRRRYNELQARLEAEAKASAAPDALDEAAAGGATILQAATLEGEAAARARLQAQREAIQDAKVRLDELLACALDEAGLQQLVAQLAAHGYGGTATGTLEDDGRLIGWTLVASRGA